MATLPELLRMIEEAKVSLIALDERIEQRVTKVTELAGRFAILGVEGGPTQALAAAKNELEQARNTRSGVAKTLERARSFAELAVDHNKGTTAGNAEVAPHTDSPTGDALAEPSPKRGGVASRLARSAMRSDASDPVKSVTEASSNISSLFQNDLDPGHVGTRAESQVPVNQPEIRSQEQNVNLGDGAVAVLALAIVATKGTQKLSQGMKKWTGRAKER